MSAAINVWINTRDRSAAAAEFDKTLDQVRYSVVSDEAARDILSIIPGDVVADLEARADQCWTGYRQVLGGRYLPTEVDSATISVQACVCRELSRAVGSLQVPESRVRAIQYLNKSLVYTSAEQTRYTEAREACISLTVRFEG